MNELMTLHPTQVAEVRQARPIVLADHVQRIKAHLAAGADGYKAAGRELLEAKTKLPHGAWLPWLCEHFSLSAREAQRYMQLADSKATRVSHLTPSCQAPVALSPAEAKVIEADELDETVTTTHRMLGLVIRHLKKNGYSREEAIDCLRGMLDTI